MTQQPHANIHFYDLTSGVTRYDEFYEPMDGYYYEIIGTDGKTIVPLFGPYANKDEVEAACKRAWDRHA